MVYSTAIGFFRSVKGAGKVLEMDEQKVLELYAKYDNCRQVAEELGTYSEAVRRVLIKHGVKRTGNRIKQKRWPSNCRHKKYCNAMVVMLCENLGIQPREISELTGVPIVSAIEIINRRCPDAFAKQWTRIDDSVVDAIEADYVDGLSTYEIGEKYGICHTTVSKLMKRRGHVRGKGYCDARIRERLDNEKREQGFQIFITRFNERYDGRFEYLGGYKGRDSKVRLKCLTCGHEFDRCVTWKNETTCPSCKQREVDDRRKAREVEKARRREQLAEQELKRDKVCKECGSVYHDEYPNSRYCSKECKRKATNRKSSIRKKRNHACRSSYRSRARKYNVQYDPTVTLGKVFERDGGICQICGLPCDWDDRLYGTSGPSYPTIDHIVAMANGGGHVWENVQLAHSICNSVKRDLNEHDEIAEAVDRHAPNGGRYERRYAPGTAESTCARDSGQHRHGRRVAQHGAARAAVPRDDTRDCRVGG